ncbi:MAG: GFA family protein [Alphaproteobacteria bacterium]|nr:GFA family protein [Alphaproteobacteria bacterium]
MTRAPKSTKPAKSAHRGGCHCGAVAFEVRTADSVELVDCNCSMCAKTGYLHLIVAKKDFRLLRGEKALATYTFNTGAAKHLFCKICGIKSFYVPRSHPDGYSVNFRCLDGGEFASVFTTQFDGRHWEQHAGELARLEEN